MFFFHPHQLFFCNESFTRWFFSILTNFYGSPGVVLIPAITLLYDYSDLRSYLSFLKSRHSENDFRWRDFFTDFRIFFFSIWVFFHEHSRFAGQQGKGEAISLTPLYHFHPLHRHLDISLAITAEISPLHIATIWS